MKESTKGILLSALVYPGLGQLVLGSKWSGILFAGLTTAGLLVIIYRLSIRFYLALDQIPTILTGDLRDLGRIFTIIDQSAYPDWSIECYGLLIVAICWVTSIIHACWAGNRLDRT